MPVRRRAGRRPRGERYRGETEPIDPVAGHIPGAVNVPTARNLDATAASARPTSCGTSYAAVGAVAGADVAAYCGSGVTAAHDVLAMEIAGVRAALYPGSWSGWITDPDVRDPVDDRLSSLSPRLVYLDGRRYQCTPSKIRASMICSDSRGPPCRPWQRPSRGTPGRPC